MTNKPLAMALDRAGSMEHQSSVMLELLGCLINQRPAVLTVFDSERQHPKHIVNIIYQPADGQAS